MGGMESPLWTPSPDRVARTRMTAFMQAVESRFGVRISDYATLYDFSISRPEDFWRLMWDFGAVRGTMGDARRQRPGSNAGRDVLSRCHAELRRQPAREPWRRRRR